MFDFLKITVLPLKNGSVEISPKFIICKSKDLMIRARDFYAIWLEEQNRWSTDEQDAIDSIDQCIRDFAFKYKAEHQGTVSIKYMWDSSSGIIDIWHKYCQKQLRDNYVVLDSKLIFNNEITQKEDYSTKKLSYSLLEGDTYAFDKLVGTLYTEPEYNKILWTIGCIVTGDSKKIQKFLVLYGSYGTGKSTVLNIFTKLFDGYCGTFDAKALGSSTQTFALETLKNNPLVAIQYDGDLSKLDSNTIFNSVVSHEQITVNEKHKSLYTMSFLSFLIMATNNPVNITDSKAGILRRLIDVMPSGKLLEESIYDELVSQIDFELGAVAYKAKEFYNNNKNLYKNYRAKNMMAETNDFYNFIDDSYAVYKKDNKTTLKDSWEMYKVYCDQAKVLKPLPMRVVKAELQAYFENYYEDYQESDTGKHVRNLYTNFIDNIFKKKDVSNIKLKKFEYKFENHRSKLDILLKDCDAQYANDKETPILKWDNVTTKLQDLDTSKLHYVKPIQNLIVIDFDLKNENGEKDYEKSLLEANKWPKTYAELSKSEKGIHLHYIYEGDVSELSSIYDENIEIKTFSGNSSLRRKLTRCNNEDISHINSGLPKKGLNKMKDFDIIVNEKAIRTLILRNLRKEYHGATKPSIDFIYKILEDAYNGGTHYDVSNLYNVILSFAMASTNQSDYCVDLVQKMKFKSKEEASSVDEFKDFRPIAFIDCEVFPNVNFVNLKLKDTKQRIHLINPNSDDIKSLLFYKLVGFNNRNYDNHIIYGIYCGNTIEQTYSLSKKIITDSRKGRYREAYGISYTDVYDYSTDKKSLKKWEIELGITHLELGLEWDKPVPVELWPKVSLYCDTDVDALEAVWYATQDDFKAREILADIAGMSVNDTTQTLAAKIIFGTNKNPELVYTDLSNEFPGYKFVKEYDEKLGRYNKYNMYRNIDVGFGGYVYAEPGMYENVALIDVESMHPHTAIALNIFGSYTNNYKNLVDARLSIKHNDFKSLETNIYKDKFMKYLSNEKDIQSLSMALKLPINIVYGLTAATYDNIFRDPRNENNIVAVRGALFMKNLLDELVKKDIQVIHIKTDSVKIVNATVEDIEFAKSYAKQYGYTFEHEVSYSKICLVNDAVYVAKIASKEYCQKAFGYIPKDVLKYENTWTATGLQFKIPYVFKTCFSKEPLEFSDYCVTKASKVGAIYLDFNEKLPNVEREEKEYKKIINSKTLSTELKNKEAESILKEIEKGHDRRFVGRVGLFCPVKDGVNGGLLVADRLKKDGDFIGYDSVTGTKGYRWMEAATLNEKIFKEYIDYSYFNSLVDSARNDISKFGDYENFIV